MHLLPSTVLTLDDWLVDIRFTGLKTGQEIQKRIGVSPHQTERGAILAALNSLWITDPARVVDVRARRRWQVWKGSTGQHPDLMARFVDTLVKEKTA